MKRLLTAALSMAVTMSAIAGSYVTTITTTRQAVVTPADVYKSRLAPWTAETIYTNGTLVALHDKSYMCVTSGTASNVAPAFVAGDITEATGVSWRPCLARDRDLLILVNDGATKVFVADDRTGPGVPMAAGAALNLIGTETIQGSLYLFTTNGTSILNHLEQ